MTLSEFKAWFSGFTESMEGVPTEKQWARITARVDEIDDKPTSYPVFIDRYVEPYRRWSPYWFAGTSVGGMVGNLASAGQTSNFIPSSEGTIGKNESNQFFNVGAAMTSLGKAEYLNS